MFSGSSDLGLPVCLSVCLSRDEGRRGLVGADGQWPGPPVAGRSRRERRCLERVIAAPRPRPASPDGVVIDHGAPSFLNTAVFAIPTVPKTVRRPIGLPIICSGQLLLRRRSWTLFENMISPYFQYFHDSTNSVVLHSISNI